MRINIKNINIANKIYFGILLLLMVSIGIKRYKYNAAERFIYDIDICTQVNQPIYITKLDVLNQDAENMWLSSSDINKNYENDCDNLIGGYDNDPKLLPSKIVLSYITYNSKCYFSDSINLDKNKLLDIFNKYSKIENADLFLKIKLYENGQVEFILDLNYKNSNFRNNKTILLYTQKLIAKKIPKEIEFKWNDYFANIENYYFNNKQDF